MKGNDLIVMSVLGVISTITLLVTIFITYKIKKFVRWSRTQEAALYLEQLPLPAKDTFGTVKYTILRRFIRSSTEIPNKDNPMKDPEKLNQDRSCCICLEDYTDGEGNPIIPDPPAENEASGSAGEATQPNAVEVNMMPSNFDILRIIAAGNREMARNHTSCPAVVQSTDLPNQIKQDLSRDSYMKKELVLGLLKCGHAFHFECIWKWMQSRTKCPVCRSYTLMNQDDIRAVSIFAVFPDLDPKNKERDSTINIYENPDEPAIPEVHKCNTKADTNQMCVFSVQKELENREESKLHRTQESRPKRLTRYKSSEFKT